MPSGHNPEGPFVRPNLPSDGKIQVLELRSPRLHVRQLTFQYHNPLVAHNQQVHLAMSGPIQIRKFKPLPMFRAWDCRCKGLFVAQPRRFRTLRPGLWQISRPQAQRRIMQPHNRPKTHAAPRGFFRVNTFLSSTQSKISPFRASNTNSAFGVSFGA